MGDAARDGLGLVKHGIGPDVEDLSAARRLPAGHGPAKQGDLRTVPSEKCQGEGGRGVREQLNEMPASHYEAGLH